MNGHGSSSFIFEVLRQVDNGPMISTKYYKLCNGVRQEVRGPFNHRVHSFKNFKCNSHNLFFGINLYRVTPSGTDWFCVL